MTTLKQLYQDKKFEDFKKEVEKDVTAINETIKLIYCDSANFDENGFVTSYSTVNNIYEIDNLEIIYKLAVIKKDNRFAEELFIKDYPEYDYKKIKTDETVFFIDFYVQINSGNVIKDRIYLTNHDLESLEPQGNELIVKTDMVLCYLSADYCSNIYLSKYNNNFFYKDILSNSYLLISEKDIRIKRNNHE